MNIQINISQPDLIPNLHLLTKGLDSLKGQDPEQVKKARLLVGKLRTAYDNAIEDGVLVKYIKDEKPKNTTETGSV